MPFPVASKILKLRSTSLKLLLVHGQCRKPCQPRAGDFHLVSQHLSSWLEAFLGTTYLEFHSLPGEQNVVISSPGQGQGACPVQPDFKKAFVKM